MAYWLMKSEPSDVSIDHLAAMVSKHLSFHHGTYYVIYEFTLDMFGLLFLTGVARAFQPSTCAADSM